MSSDTAMARLTGLTKRFIKGKETIAVFDRLDLAIPQGDFVAVMGLFPAIRAARMPIVAGLYG